MKTINKIISLFVLFLFLGFVACQEDSPKWEPTGTPGFTEGVFFPATNKAVVELEPSEPTEIIIDVSRAESANASNVPIVVTVNTENVFVVPNTVAFAAGAKTAQIKVTFPTAAEGVTYRLTLSVEGDEFVDIYGSGAPYVSTSVTRIKWDAAGSFIYLDGTFFAGWGIPGQYPQYVEAEKAIVGGATRYRLKNVYNSMATDEDEYGILNGFPWNDPEDFDEGSDYYTLITVNTNNTVSMEPHSIGVDWGYGMMSIGSIYPNLSSNLASYPLGVKVGDEITFGASSLYYNQPSYAGARVCGTPTLIYLSLDAYLAANMKIENFNDIEYDEIKGAISEFESKAYNDSWNQRFFVAVDIDEENPDSEYKDLYYLSDLYANNFGLAFYFDGEDVTIPAGQATGRTAFGQKVFVSKSTVLKSSVTTTEQGVTVYTLGLKFHYADGTVLGDFAETYFYSKNAIEYSIDDFCGNYTIIGAKSMFSNLSPLSRPVTIEKGTKANTLIIKGIQYVASVEATFDPVNSYMDIGYQWVDDYGPSPSLEDMEFLTFDGNYSETAFMTFTKNLKGQLVLIPGSEAVGFMIWADVVNGAAGGWINGWYDISFNPRAASSAPLKSSAPQSLPIVNGDKKDFKSITIIQQEKSLNGNFSIQPKQSVKTPVGNMGIALPF